VTHRPALHKLLALHSASTAVQTAHDIAVEQGDNEAATSLHKMGVEISTLIGKLVVAESKKTRAVEATP
jgi:hypothetical protein